MNQKFKVYCSDISKSQDSKTELDKPLMLEGIASTTGVDFQGDFMTPECIKSMKEQALKLNIHGDHLKKLKGVIGTVIDVIDTDDSSLKIKFNILPSFRKQIEEYLDYGVSLGLSIGGKALDYEQHEDGWKIKNIQLHEISLTPLPANFDTFGSVHVTKGLITARCLNGACKQIIDNIEKNVVDNTFEETEQDNLMTESKVMDMLNEAINNSRDEIFSILREQYKIDELKDFLTVYQAKEDLKTEENLEQTKNVSQKGDNKDMKEDEKQNQSGNEPVEDNKEDKKPSECKGCSEEECSENDCDNKDCLEKGCSKKSKKEEKQLEEEPKEDKKEKSLEDTSDLKEQIKSDLIKEIKESLREEIRKEVETELTESLKEEVRKEVEEEILEELSSNREPQSKQSEDNVLVDKSLDTESENKKTMNIKDIAKYLATN